MSFACLGLRRAEGDGNGLSIGSFGERSLEESFVPRESINLRRVGVSFLVRVRVTSLEPADEGSLVPVSALLGCLLLLGEF